MTAVSKLPEPRIAAASGVSGSLAHLRQELSRRFPGAILAIPHDDRGERARDGDAPLLQRSPFAWVEMAIGEGGLAWLAAWTSLVVARDPLGRPALWVDTHCTYTAGDLLDLEGKVVVVRPPDPHEAHVAADIALRAGSFSMVALEMHRALHPKPLARLARLATARAHSDRTRTPLVLWGEPPSFVAPPSGVPRTPFNEAIHALYEGLARGAPHDQPEAVPNAHASGSATAAFTRALHTTDRLRPLDRAADRRASAAGPGQSHLADGRGGWGGRMDEHGDRPARLSSVPYSREPREPR